MLRSVGCCLNSWSWVDASVSVGREIESVDRSDGLTEPGDAQRDRQLRVRESIDQFFGGVDALIRGVGRLEACRLVHEEQQIVGRAASTGCLGCGRRRGLCGDAPATRRGHAGGDHEGDDKSALHRRATDDATSRAQTMLATHPTIASIDATRRGRHAGSTYWGSGLPPEVDGTEADERYEADDTPDYPPGDGGK